MYYIATTYGGDLCHLLGHEKMQNFIKNPPKDPPYDLMITEVMNSEQNVKHVTKKLKWKDMYDQDQKNYNTLNYYLWLFIVVSSIVLFIVQFITIQLFNNNVNIDVV